MSYKPNDLFVGVIDVFAILLPGALLAFALRSPAERLLFGELLPPLTSPAQAWVAFFFASYLLGHFVFLFGALLDGTLYDPFRRRFLRRDGDRLYRRATALRDAHLGRLLDPDGDARPGEEVINTFKWARARVQLYAPGAAVEVSRLEADSKFFRSLIVVLVGLALAAALAGRGGWWPAAACLGLALLAFVRYADQRYKSTSLAYTYLLAMETGRDGTGAAARRPNATRAASEEAARVPT